LPKQVVEAPVIDAGVVETVTILVATAVAHPVLV
jgi:hypothetical protein